MSDICVIGDPISCEIFTAQDVDIYTENFKDNFEKVKDKYKVIILLEEAYMECKNLIGEDERAAILVLPSIKSRTDLGKKLLKRVSIIATGSEI